jgi:hypothetical protein
MYIYHTFSNFLVQNYKIVSEYPRKNAFFCYIPEICATGRTNKLLSLLPQASVLALSSSIFSVCYSFLSLLKSFFISCILFDGCPVSLTTAEGEKQ